MLVDCVGSDIAVIVAVSVAVVGCADGACVSGGAAAVAIAGVESSEASEANMASRRERGVCCGCACPGAIEVAMAGMDATSGGGGGDGGRRGVAACVDVAACTPAAASPSSLAPLCSIMYEHA